MGRQEKVHQTNFNIKNNLFNLESMVTGFNANAMDVEIHFSFEDPKILTVFPLTLRDISAKCYASSKQKRVETFL